MRLPTLDLTELGKEIAHGNDDEQSAIFNAFAAELLTSCGRRSGSSETQICYISDKLSWQAMEVFNSLGEFIKLRNKERNAKEGQ